MPASTETSARPRLLFVDDEQRVLNSMNIMFRRSYELFLASNGSKALDIIREEDIDVIVADHRMPQMTGVEVLTAVRTLSPRTVRILLTGYADLDAVEGSINEGEVFRFLTKPCPPEQLRQTIDLAARLAREAPSAVMPQPATEDEVDEASVDFLLSAPPPRGTEPTGSDVAAGHTATAARSEPPRHPTLEGEGAARPRSSPGMGVVVFSNDEHVIDVVQSAIAGRLPVHHATNIVQVVNILTEHRPGVLVTDISEDKATIQTMTGRLKQHLPELVTICISQHRDVLDMVWLINHGQIFRFLRKPLSPGRCAVSLRAALRHHRALLDDPALVKRHEVQTPEQGGIVEGVLARLKTVRRLWASA